MKVSYIILPFTDSTYLVRCVNSLYRQLGNDYEVILAENDFGRERERIEEFLDSKSQLLRIAKPEPSAEMQKAAVYSNTEKLEEATSLISKDSDYVMYIDVNTVVSPICTVAILKCSQSGLIIPSIAIERESEFVPEYCDIFDFQKNIDKYTPQRICFAKKLIDQFKTECMENNELFSFFLMSALVNNPEIAVTKDICMYVQSCDVPESKCDIGFETVYELCNSIFSKLFDIQNVETRVIVFEKIIRHMCTFLNNDRPEVGQQAFEVLKDYYRGVQQDFLLRKFIEITVGVETDEIWSMNREQFIVYKSYVRGTGNPVTTIDCAMQNTLLEDMKAVLDSTKKELSDMKRDVAIIKSKTVTVNMPAPTAPGTVIGDPCVDIPKMYREGRLGFKIIWRSFWGWFKYKFSRKK